MAQMNVIYEKETIMDREQTCGYQGGKGLGEEWSGRLGLVDISFYT